MIVLTSLLIGSGASAQTAGDASRTPSGNLVRNGPFQVAYSEWRRLPQGEVNCVDQWYRAQGSNLW
jgi:large exoprotein involved in heme utilization and adhesion